MNFFKNLFTSNKPIDRTLEDISQLQSKDIIRFSDSFALPSQLRNHEFQISSINSHEFETNTITEWALLGTTDQPLYLTKMSASQPYFKISMRIDDEDIETLFDLDEFSEVFSEPGQAILNRKLDNAKTNNWTAEQYQQNTFAQVGYFHRQDITKLSEQEIDQQGEAFELYQLRGNDEQYSIDIQVWNDGETNVFLNLYRPLTDIIDLYPGS